MTFEPDYRLREAENLVRSGKIKCLSLDVFDTLIARRVPKPFDLFLRLGVILQEKGLLGVGLSSDSFAAMRYQTEHSARNKCERENGHREVTLREIYEQAPKQMAVVSVGELVALEIEAEKEFVFANLEIVALAKQAVSQGVKLALLSNMYLGKKVVMELVRKAAPDFPLPDAVFVSSDHRIGKRDGLMKAMLDHFAVEPFECLHIGDNPKSDRDVAVALGVRFVFLGDDPDFTQRLAEEHPLQWYERVRFFGGVFGDCGQTWLRKVAGFWRPSDLKVDDLPYYSYGAQMMGPLLNGFACWVGARLRESGLPVLYGLTREGDFLSQVVRKAAPDSVCRLLSISRLAGALASFSPEHPAFLEDFLTRRGFWTIGTLMQQLGFSLDEACLIADPNLTLASLSPRVLTQQILESPLAKPLFERSAARRQRLLKHLKKIGALDCDKLWLMDLGYAATIQRALQRIFLIEQIPVQTHGLYMAAAHVSLGTQAVGGVVEGFLAQNGNPNDFACAFCRSPEVVELSCMPSYGTVLDYTEDGDPIYAEERGLEIQRHQIALVQRGVVDYVERFACLSVDNKESFLSDFWKNQVRAIALRAVVYPTDSEACLFADWLADSDMGLSSPRPLLSCGANIGGIAGLSAVEMAALPRRDLPWLYGIAAHFNPSQARILGNLLCRKA